MILMVYDGHMHNDTYQHNNCQVHIRAASWRGVKEEKRTLPRNLLTKMVRIRLKTEVVTAVVMVIEMMLYTVIVLLMVAVDFIDASDIFEIWFHQMFEAF